MSASVASPTLLLRRYLASGRTKNGKNFDFGTERATKCPGITEHQVPNIKRIGVS
jgi:hypothetical protein